jgi:hypothetical protein
MIYTYDLFLCHASEDKEVARPLVTTLQGRNWHVWFDELELTMGDSLTREIDRGLASARFGIVLLSPSFFEKRWPERELEGLTAREIVNGEKVILPIWHRIDAEYIATYSPSLAARLAPSTEDGVPVIVEKIEGALRKAGVAGPDGRPWRAEAAEAVEDRASRQKPPPRKPRLTPQPVRTGGEEEDGPATREVVRRIGILLSGAVVGTLLLIIILRSIGS